MRLDVPTVVFLSQTIANEIDALARAPWWAAWLVLALGGTAGAARAWTLLADHLKEKRELARRAADEDRARRDAKAAAEIEQLNAMTSMARDVPKHFDAMKEAFATALSKIGETNALMSKRIDENTAATNKLSDSVHELQGELRSDTRELVQAIARQVGAQRIHDETNASGVRRLSVPGESQGLRP